MPIVEPLTVTSEVASQMLGVTSRTLYTLRKKGLIKARPVDPDAKSPTWLYLVESLKQYARGE